MSHLIFLTKKVGRNQNQGETSQGEMSQGEMSVREKCLLAKRRHYFSKSTKQKPSSHYYLKGPIIPREEKTILQKKITPFIFENVFINLQSTHF